MSKRLISIFVISLTICISRSSTSQEQSTPPDGWYEIKIPLGKSPNAFRTHDVYFLNRDVGWIVGRRMVEVGTQACLALQKVVE